ncbi:MAG: LamG domain-containing protein, partial [Pontimonas sp.]|nr:LamG domain-containing protein [Pontimonas sp.]
MSIVSKGSDGTDANTSIKLWYDHSDTDLAFTVGDGSTSTTVRTDGITLAVDTWYHVRCFNDGNRMGIAVNGTLYGSGTARAPLTETGLLYLGSDFSNNYFDGVLDEVALFSTAPTIADGATLYSGGTGTTLPVLDNLTGPTGRAGAGSRFNSPSFAESNESVVYMAHGKMPVQRFDGTLARAGVESPTQKVTLKSSGSGSLTGRRYAYLRFLDASGQVSSVSPLSDVHDTFGTAGSAITGATNASPIVITSASHGLTTGQTVRVTGQLGNTAANGTWKVNVQSVDTFALEGSVGNGDWAASEAPAMQVTVQRAGSSGTSQVQTLSYSNAPTAGSFTLSFRGDTTTTLTYDDTAADIQAALEALPSIGEDNVVCAGGAL